MDEQEAAPSGNKGARIGLYVAAAGVLIGAGYLGLAAIASDKVEQGTTVAGVDIGGLSRQDAQDKIDTAMTQRATQPITIAAEGHTLKVVPKSSGLTTDTSHALDGKTGFTLAPGTVWHRVFGGGGSAQNLPTKVNRQVLISSVTSAGGSLKGAPQQGTVAYVDGVPTVTKRSVPGKGIDAAAVADQIAAGWPARTSYTAAVKAQTPAITNDELDAFAAGPATVAVSKPVEVTNGQLSVTIPKRELPDLLTVTNSGGKLALQANSSKLKEFLEHDAPELAAGASNGKVVIDAQGAKTYTAPAAGTTIDPTGSDADFLKAVSSATGRSFAAKTKNQLPTMTLDDLKSMKLDKLSTFDTPLPGGATNAARTKNIKIALGTINGMVVAKGQQFSLLNALGKLDASKGYVDAPTIQGGIEIPALGGGLSQVSTTVYNASFFAGVQLDEHTAHAFWIPRYPMGREATLWTGTIDNRWTNDTNGAIAIQAEVTTDSSGQQVVRVTYYGTPTFTVASTTSAKYAFTSPKTQYINSAVCLPQAPSPGFSVLVTRVVKQGDKVVRNERLVTTYIPSDQVICSR